MHVCMCMSEARAHILVVRPPESSTLLLETRSLAGQDLALNLGSPPVSASTAMGLEVHATMAGF